jgi:hypothetical protein
MSKRLPSRLSSENQGLTMMRMLMAFVAIVYLVGVGVALSPTIQSEWNSGSPSSLASSIGQALPNALAWPAHI